MRKYNFPLGMYQTGLLLLTGPLRVVIESIGHYLNYANKRVAKCLYVKLEPELCRTFSKSDSVNLGRLSSILPSVYCKASSICKNIDVRVLLANIKQSKYGNNKPIDFDVILTNNDDDKDVHRYLEVNFSKSCDIIIKLDTSIDSNSGENLKSDSEFKTYKTVCLGGTFDRLHNGHKVLLSQAVLRSSEKLIVGVSKGTTMLHRKVLCELIEPIEKRIDDVTNFLLEVDPSLCYEVVPIIDPYGPTIVNPDIECLVVTTETKVGGDKVNFERNKKGMKEVVLDVVDLVENADHTTDEEEKLSSSTQRMQLLGVPRKNLKKSHISGSPYYILLKGHFLTGKSYIASRFQKLGLPVLSCDEMCHAILKKDNSIVEGFVREFSDDLSCASGTFDFKRLVLLCLRSKDKKDWLTQAVYLKVKSTLQQVLEVYCQQGAHTILISDSSLFEDSELGIEFHEVWTSILPVSETKTLLKDQCNFTEDEVTETVESLIPNERYADVANIIFCNKWSTDVIQEQVNRAWSYLKSVQQ